MLPRDVCRERALKDGDGEDGQDDLAPDSLYHPQQWPLHGGRGEVGGGWGRVCGGYVSYDQVMVCFLHGYEGC